jgi:CubicO group peptidase (beta-lactamase class C family)
MACWGASFALAGAALGAPVSAASERTAAEPELQRSLDRVVAAGAPGAVLLVRESGQTIRLTSGYEKLKPRTPVRSRNRFRVGSVTKTLVATVALQLVGERKLSLADTAERWLPGVVPTPFAMSSCLALLAGERFPECDFVAFWINHPTELAVIRVILDFV